MEPRGAASRLRIESRAEKAREETEAVARRALAKVHPEDAAAVLGDNTLLPGGSPDEGETPAG